MTLTVVPVTFRQACGFIDAHHRHHRPPQGIRFALGVTADGKLVGVATVGRPVARHLDDAATAEITRVATDGTGNANSMLYAACWRAARAMGYQRIVTYTQDGETGASLRAAGFCPAAHLPAGSGWDRPSRSRTGDTGGVARTRWEIHTRRAAPAPEPSDTAAAAPASPRTRASRPTAASAGSAPPFAYYGGKTRLASRIAALLPDHQQYVEPFAGSLAVLLAKPPARKETVNDLDGDLVGFWRTLRDQPSTLIRACALTPHSRTEHAAACQPLSSADTDTDTDTGEQNAEEVERARRVWVRLTQGRSGALAPTGWRRSLNPNGPALSMPGYLAGYRDRIPAAAARLAGVTLECRPGAGGHRRLRHPSRHPALPRPALPRRSRPIPAPHARRGHPPRAGRRPERLPRGRGALRLPLRPVRAAVRRLAPHHPARQHPPRQPRQPRRPHPKRGPVDQPPPSGPTDRRHPDRRMTTPGEAQRGHGERGHGERQVRWRVTAIGTAPMTQEQFDAAADALAVLITEWTRTRAQRRQSQDSAA